VQETSTEEPPPTWRSISKSALLGEMVAPGTSEEQMLFALHFSRRTVVVVCISLLGKTAIFNIYW
jgi:hypothetical protein